MGIDIAALPGATVFEGVPADTPETVSFILKEKNVSSLERQVEAGVRHYLSVSQFARIYGQSDVEHQRADQLPCRRSGSTRRSTRTTLT